MAAKNISLKELRQHVKALDKLVTDAWFQSAHPAEISFDDVRKHARGILALVGEGEAMAAATDNEGKKDAQKRAAYQRAAADKATAFNLSGIYIKS